VCAAITSAAHGLCSLSRSSAAVNARPSADSAEAQSPRFADAPQYGSLAPPQLAAAVMLAGGGSVALVAPHIALVPVIVCIVGAVGTVAAGSWQSARYALRREAAIVGCGSDCAACTLTSASGASGSCR
jgi:hypothetical protein